MKMITPATGGSQAHNAIANAGNHHGFARAARGHGDRRRTGEAEVVAAAGFGVGQYGEYLIHAPHLEFGDFFQILVWGLIGVQQTREGFIGVPDLVGGCSGGDAEFFIVIHQAAPLGLCRVATRLAERAAASAPARAKNQPASAGLCCMG